MTGTFGEPAAQFGVRISPDGSRLATAIYDAGTQSTQIWIGDVARGVRTRLTSGASSNTGPIWSPDGSKIAFQTDRKHQADVYAMAVGRIGRRGGGHRRARAADPDGLVPGWPDSSTSTARPRAAG